MFDSSSFGKGYAIIIMIAFFLIVLNFVFNGMKNKRLRSYIKSDGVQTHAKINKIESYTGKMYQYTNVHLCFDYVTKDGSLHSGEGKTVVFTSDIDKYQPGEEFLLTYSNKKPDLFIIEIENASLK